MYGLVLQSERKSGCITCTENDNDSCLVGWFASSFFSFRLLTTDSYQKIHSYSVFISIENEATLKQTEKYQVYTYPVGVCSIGCNSNHDNNNNKQHCSYSCRELMS